MSEHNVINNQCFSFLGKNCEINGTFKFSGPTHIASNIEGTIIMQDNSDLFIERDAFFKGDIKCHNIEIHGKIQGSIEATGRILLHPPASLVGDIIGKDIIVQPGASLNITGHTFEEPSLKI